MRIFLLIALITVFVAVDRVEAQQSRRGRFFQKIKNDLFAPPKTPSQNDTAKTPSKTPTLNTDLQNQDPRRSTPRQTSTRPQIQRPYQSQQPTLANLGDYYRSNSASRYSNSTQQKEPTNSSSVFTPKSSSTYQARQVKTKSSSNSKGFGFAIRMDSNDALVVTAVDRAGNAAKEGLRRGDIVLEIGGIEATSVEEFDEISKVMNDGDQLEFKIKRSGREKNLDISFGKTPSSDVAGNVEENRPSKSQARRYDFAPPAGSSTKGNSVHNSRTPTGANSNYASETAATRQIRYLNQTIEKQNRQIQYLQQQVQHYQRSNRSR